MSPQSSVPPITPHHLSSSVIASDVLPQLPQSRRGEAEPHWGRFSQRFVVFRAGQDYIAPTHHSFLTSDSPGSLFNDAAAHPHLNSTLFASLDTVSNNYPSMYPIAQRSTPVPSEPPCCT